MSTGDLMAGELITGELEVRQLASVDAWMMSSLNAAVILAMKFLPQSLFHLLIFFNATQTQTSTHICRHTSTPTHSHVHTYIQTPTDTQTHTHTVTCGKATKAEESITRS